eukprot:symbB.v1.2.036819.t1/scaffold5286.1/size30633/2
MPQGREGGGKRGGRGNGKGGQEGKRSGGRSSDKDAQSTRSADDSNGEAQRFNAQEAAEWISSRYQASWELMVNFTGWTVTILAGRYGGV